MSKTSINAADGVANRLTVVNFHCFIFNDDRNDMPCSSLFLLSGNDVISLESRPLIFMYLYTCTPRTKQTALLQRCRMASRSATKELPQILAAVESPLTAINSTFAAVQKIPESRPALQSGFEKTKNVVTGNRLPLVCTKKKKCRLQ